MVLALPIPMRLRCDRHSIRVWLGVAWLLGTLGMSSLAPAQPSQAEINVAKAAFQAGLALEAAGDYAQALGRFREVVTVKATPQALFHVGRCLEQLGKWSEAVGTYRLALEKADQPSESTVRQQADAARIALEPRLPKLIIDRGYGAGAASLTLDGVPLGGTAVGSPMPADPGTHVVTAVVTGSPPVNFEVVLHEGETKRVSVEFGAAPAEPPSASAEAQQPVESAPASTVWTRRNGYYVGGAGVASLVIGTVLLVLRQSAVDDLEYQCYMGHCPASLKGTSDRAKVFTILGDTFMGLGVAGVGVGTIMILRDRRGDAGASAKPSARGVWVAPVGPTGVGASMGGVF